MATTINITTVLKAFLAKTPNRPYQMVGHFNKTDGTPVQVWYDPVSDVLYADPTFNTADTQNPSLV
jgi:hypothetical protein